MSEVLLGLESTAKFKVGDLVILKEHNLNMVVKKSTQWDGVFTYLVGNEKHGDHMVIESELELSDSNNWGISSNPIRKFSGTGSGIVEYTGEIPNTDANLEIKCSCGAKYTSRPTYHMSYCNGE